MMQCHLCFDSIDHRAFSHARPYCDDCKRLHPEAWPVWAAHAVQFPFADENGVTLTAHDGDECDTGNPWHVWTLDVWLDDGESHEACVGVGRDALAVARIALAMGHAITVRIGEREFTASEGFNLQALAADYPHVSAD